METNHIINYYCNLVQHGVMNRIDSEQSLLKYYLKNYCFDLNSTTNLITYKELEKQASDNSIPMKLRLIENIPYQTLSSSGFGHFVPIMKLFVLEYNGILRCFTHRGKITLCGYPDEHSLEDFVCLLNEHPDLKDNDAIKQMKASVRNQMLQNSLSSPLSAVKKIKI